MTEHGDTHRKKTVVVVLDQLTFPERMCVCCLYVQISTAVSVYMWRTHGSDATGSAGSKTSIVPTDYG